MVKFHGTVECFNPDCPSFKIGYTFKPKDPHTAVAIAGASTLLSDAQQTLPLFSPSMGPSSSNTTLSTPVSNPGRNRQALNTYSEFIEAFLRQAWYINSIMAEHPSTVPGSEDIKIRCVKLQYIADEKHGYFEALVKRLYHEEDGINGMALVLNPH
ncbi:hypothetical protein BGZ65_002457 [Modicella reniformis]|uniref:Uncharacterized protein n=1 Tax=Modicella reniformis TaxID=1440133 RepID=A0A9P6MIQ9_9FUNG|nr:hypothetical protein BGZ65_002457 [Modicella reniformis]